jgi:3-hydroxybutyryl-CoA dehydrogenase
MSDPRFAAVTVLGAGTMGAGIAQVAAQAGSRVVLQDIGQELVDQGRERIAAFLQKGVDKGKVTPEQKADVLARITTTVDRAAACRAAELVVEAVPERLDIKNALFKEVAGIVAPGCVLASNTSSLSLAKVFAGVARPERCIGMHFFNPVPLMKLLEIVQTVQKDSGAVCLASTQHPIQKHASDESPEDCWAGDPGSHESVNSLLDGIDAHI